MEKLLIVLLSVFPFVLGRLISLAKKDSFHPATITLYFWGVFLFSSMVFLWEVDFSILTLAYLLISFFLYTISTFLFPLNKKIPINKIEIDLVFVKKICIIAPLVSMVCSMVVVADSGIELNKFLTGFSSAAGEFATMRGTKGVSYGLAGVISIGLGYFSSWVAGLLMIISSKDKKYMYFAITPIVFIMLIQSAKLIIFVGLAMFISGVMIGRILNRSANFKFTFFLKLKNIFILALLLALIAFSFTTRDGYGNSSGIGELFGLLKYLVSSYLFGPLYAFDDFLKFTVGMASNSIYLDDYNAGGVYTFYSLFSLMGFEKQFPVGTYAETGFVDGIYETNIFTAFRGLIYDFGVIGSILVLMVIGFIFNYNYYVARKDCGPLRLAFASITIPFGFIIYLISPFMANYLFLQVAIIFIFLKMAFKK